MPCAYLSRLTAAQSESGSDAGRHIVSAVSTKKKRSLAVKILLWLLYAAVFAYVIATLVSGGRPPGIARFAGMFRPQAETVRTGEYVFDVGRNRVFADLDGMLAAAGTLGIQVLDSDGAEVLRDPFRMQSPAIDSAGGNAIAFDVGGTQLRVFNNSEIVAEIEAAGRIVSASINQNGWFTVITQEDMELRGIITVYNNRGRAEWRVHSAAGYALHAELSPDNRNIAVLRLTYTGSHVAFWEIGSDSDNPIRFFELPQSLIVDIKYLPGGNVLAVSTESLIVINRNGVGRAIVEFEGRRLGGFAASGRFIAVHLLDYGVGYRGQIITVRENGSVLGEKAINKELVSMSINGDLLAILWSDGVMFYDSGLNESPPLGDNVSGVEARRVVALPDGMALAAGESSAVVLEIDSQP